MFVDIPNFEGLYQIDLSGQVYSVRKKRVIKGGLYPNGYRFVCLCKNGYKSNYMVHRLVASTFIHNNDLDANVVNHIDGNKLNNHVTNLEWCTASENLQHALRIGLVENQCKIRRSVIMTHTLTKEVRFFKSMKECCDYFGFTKCWLGNYIRKNGNPCTYFGYKIEVRESEVVKKS